MSRHLEILYPQKQYTDLRELLQTSVSRFENNKAFIIKMGSKESPEYIDITYKHFGSMVESLAAALHGRGITNGTPVAIMGKNSCMWAAAYFAAVTGGNTAVPLDKGLPLNEAESSLVRSRAKVFFFDAANQDMADRLRQRGNTEVVIWAEMGDGDGSISGTAADRLIAEGDRLIRSGNNSCDTTVIDPDSTAVILFTSGTTSKSKAVMLSHTNLCANVYGFTSCEKLLSDDVSLAFLPYHHTYGATAALISMLSCGACSVFCDGLKHLYQNLKEYNVSVFMSVPLLVEALYKKTLSGTRNYDSLRLIMSGAGPVDPKATDALNQMGILTAQIYGLTETSPALTIETEKSIRKGSVGKPLPNLDIKIVDPDENGVGEVTAKGPNVMQGYYEDPSATSAVMKDGWFHTGDLGYIDKDGYLFLCGRRKNVIVLKSGKNIYPEEIETLVNGIPYITESMACGVPRRKNDPNDPVLCLKAVYDPEYLAVHYPGEDIRSVIDRDLDRINEMMPAYKQIKKLIITDEPMIKTSTSKIKRHMESDSILADAVDF